MIEVFGISFRLYGLIVGVAIVSGAEVVARILKREGHDVSWVWDGLVWVVLAGMVGARAYHVIDLWSYYVNHLGQVVAVWQGGLGIFGALIGGGLGLVGFLRFGKGAWKFKQTLGKNTLVYLLDAVSFGLPLGQAIGRWGNFANQELYGLPSNLPWAVYVSPANRVSGYEAYSRFTPLFLYESLLNLVLFGVLTRLYQSGKFKLGSGGYVAVYLIGYGLIRFFLEFLRIERWEVAAFPVAAYISLLLVLVGLSGLMAVVKKNGVKKKEERG